MRTLLAIALLALSPAAFQSQARPPAPPHNSDPGIAEANRLEAKARSILKAEMARADHYDINKSNAEFTACLSADFEKTNRNYLDFSKALQAIFAIPDPDAPPDIYPSGEKPFASGEAAWRIYRDRTCEAVADSYDGGTGAGMADISCKKSLTRQHMKGLADIHLSKP
jgi:uncharacterized protein YecT (DUF1311 family)